MICPEYNDIARKVDCEKQLERIRCHLPKMQYIKRWPLYRVFYRLVTIYDKFARETKQNPVYRQA